MRRLVGLVAAGLGAFFVVLGVLTHLVVVRQAVKFPLNEYLISTLVARNASYFSTSKLSELSGVTLQTTTTVEGDVAAGTSNIAVWNEFSYVYDETNHQPFEYTTERLAFNRRSGALDNCCGAFIGTNRAVHMSGLGFVWPFNTQKQNYQLYDTTLLRPEPVKYEGTADVDGVTAYKFVEDVPATKVGNQTIPGSLIGENKSSVTLGQYDQTMNTMWVNPVIGAPVKVQRDEEVTLRDSTGATRLVLINADFKLSPSSVAAAVATVKSDDTKTDLVTTTIPLISIILGIVLLVLGLALARSARYEQAEVDDDEYVDA
jgi:hypothetical protein